jgi:hypothetical protein
MTKIVNNLEHYAYLKLFLLLNLMDFCTTAVIISRGGVELMPIAAGFIEWYGLLGLFLHKFVIAAGLGYLCRNQSQRTWEVINWCFALIIAWNSSQIFFDLLNYASTNA